MMKVVRLLKMVAAALGNQGIIMLGNFFAFMIFLKGMNIEVLSLWIVFQTISSIIDYSRLSILQNAFINFYSDDLDKGTLIGTTLWMQIFLSVLSILLFTSVHLIITTIQGEFSWYFVGGYVLQILGVASFQIVALILQAQHKHLQIMLHNLFAQSITLLALLFLFQSGEIEIYQPILIALLLAIFNVLYFIFPNRKVFKGLKFSRELSLQIIRYGKVVMSGNFVSLLISKSDILLLSMIANPSGIAVYHLAQKLNNYFEVPLTAITQVYYPKIRTVIADRLAVGYYLNQSITVQLLLIVPAAMIFYAFAFDILALISNATYAQSAAPILRILLLASVVRPIGRSLGLLFDVQFRSDINFRILLLVGSLTLILQYSFGMTLGLQGLAIATVIGTYGGIMLAQFVAFKTFQFSLLGAYFQFIKNKTNKLYEILTVKFW